jgi:hypothetical protein
MVKPPAGGSRLDRLPSQLVIDRSDPRGGIRIALKDAPKTTKASSNAAGSPRVPEYTQDSPYATIKQRFGEPPAF